jgi:DNA-binding SARP family transcriptional activator/Tfp pilus assembly protein PilF
MIHLQTLGRVGLRAAGAKRASALQTRPKDLALLTYLAAGPCGFRRRDLLLGIFWPDLDASHGRNALSQALHRLRSALPSGILVVGGREEVGLSSDRLTCDAVSFERHLQAGELNTALKLYEGEFLDGFHARGAGPEFDHWVLGERERLHRLAFNALLVLVEVEEKSGSEEAAITWLRRALDLRPCDETICRRLIEALTAAGDRSGALAEYDRFAQRLRDDYGLSPSADTRSLPEAIRQHEASACHPGRPRGHAPSPGVHEAFLKGRYFTSTIEQTALGLEYLQQAITRDSAYAPAHAAIAMSVANLAIVGHLTPHDAKARACGAATRAIELDPTLCEAHIAAAMTSMIFDWNWSGAEREFRVGIDLDPNSSDAHAYFAQFLCAVARPDEGVAEAEAAQRLDPLGPWANFTLGWTLFRARRHAESVERLRRLLELYPHFAYAHLFLAENHVSTGAYAEAVEACGTALEILPDDQLLLGLTACVLGLSGAEDLSRSLRRRLEALAHSCEVCPGHLAAAHLGLADRDRAFECWDAMCRNRSALACFVPADPLYDCVRPDPRFGELFDRMRIPRPCPAGAIRSDAGTKRMSTGSTHRHDVSGRPDGTRRSSRTRTTR